MTAAQDLMNNPTEFMQNNIVVVPTDGNTTNQIFNGTVNLSLYSRPRTAIRGRKKDLFKSAMNVYFLAPQGSIYVPDAIIDPNTITAYFCPYQQNNTHGTVVSNAADLCFTTQMDGCTFAIGHNAGGSRLVMHTNQASAGDANNPFSQSNAQDANLRTAFNAQGSQIDGVLAPLDYRTSSKGTSYQATTFGVRNGGDWQFYTQRFTLQINGMLRTFVFKELKQFFG